jgi:hypothetical protein
MSQFEKYNDVIFDAFCLHSKRKEIVDRKLEIVDKIFEFYNASAESILFVGFNPAILSARAKEIYVTEVSDDVFKWLQTENKNIQKYNIAEPRKFDAVIAFDEYLTFAGSELEQQNNINTLCKLATTLVITTVKDYKNQEFKDREYSQPAIIKSNNKLSAFTEIHDWDFKDKNVFVTALYQLAGIDSSCRSISNRRTLFFKQLAKFCMDSGASNFLVHKNLMYKSLIKKNYEHVISIHFEN